MCADHDPVADRLGGAEILFWLTSRRTPRLGKGSGSVMVGSRRPYRVPGGRRLRLAWLRTCVRLGGLAIGIGSAVRVVRHELLLGSRSMAAMLPVQSWSGRARETNQEPARGNRVAQRTCQVSAPETRLCKASSPDPLPTASATCSRARSSYVGASTSRNIPI